MIIDRCQEALDALDAGAPDRPTGITDDVDWLAIEFVCNGTPMRLSRRERVIAGKRLAGTVPAAVIADRVGTTQRTVTRIFNGAGAVRCSTCQQLVLHTEHVGRNGLPCGEAWWQRRGKDVTP